MFIFIIILFACIGLGTYYSIKEQKDTNLLTETAKRNGYYGFNKDVSLNEFFHADSTRRLFASRHNDNYTIIPFDALQEVNYEVIYDYKTESNASFSQGLADGILSGITGVGIIREIREEQVQYIKELKLKLNFNHNGRYFVENVSVTGNEASAAASILEFLSAILKNNQARSQLKSATAQKAQAKAVSKNNLENSNSPQATSDTPETLKSPKVVDKTTWDSRITSALSKSSDEKVSALLEVATEGSVRAYNLLGLHYSNLSNFQKAFHYYKLAYDIDPNYANLLNNLGFLYSEKDFSDFDIEKSFMHLKSADIGIAYHNMASLYDGTRGGTKDSKFIDYDSAIYYYEKALLKGYDSDITLNNLGRLYGDKKGKYVLASSYCYLSGEKGNATGKNNFLSYTKELPEPQRKLWIENIKLLKSHTEIEGMIERVSSALNICAEYPEKNIQPLEDKIGNFNFHDYHRNNLKTSIRELFPNFAFTDDDIVFNLRGELAILKPSNKVCITKYIPTQGKTQYYIADAFDVCSYRKSNGNLFLTFNYDGELPDDETHRMWPGREIKVLTATPEEAESVFSHIKAHLSVNKINHF